MMGTFHQLFDVTLGRERTLLEGLNSVVANEAQDPDSGTSLSVIADVVGSRDDFVRTNEISGSSQPPGRELYQ